SYQSRKAQRHTAGKPAARARKVTRFSNFNRLPRLIEGSRLEIVETCFAGLGTVFTLTMITHTQRGKGVKGKGEEGKRVMGKGEKGNGERVMDNGSGQNFGKGVPPSPF